MNRQDDRDRKSTVETFKSSAVMLLFGLAILAFLIAIDRPQWFHIRPFSGAALAMSHASAPAAPDRAVESR